MQLLGIDIGSSSVKCAILKDGRTPARIVHAKYETHRDGSHVEVEPTVLLNAIRQATKDLGAAAKRAEAVALSVFSPGWVAMDAAGRPLTPIVSHQDRRSVDVALDLEKRVGQKRILAIAGSRPFPGGISSTTWAWFERFQPAVLKKADLIGHLNTFLHRQFTGARVVDTANASFMGVYRTCDLGGWSDELCQAVGARASQLPEVHEANEIGGTLTREAASELGLREGTPMTVGVVDGSSAMLLAGSKVGQLLNVCGSTDVLALCTGQFKPHPRLLTRALGVGKKWLSVSTIASAGSAISWAKDQFFPKTEWKEFEALARKLSRAGAGAKKAPPSEGVRFEPYLAGDRMSVEQRQGAFTGLTLSTTREQMLGAILEAMAWESASRIDLLKQAGARIHHDVIVTGGLGKLTSIFHRDWQGKWAFKLENEATLRGLWTLAPTEKK